MTKYQHGHYEIDVDDSGAILVKQGDWLGKFSAAIYNDFIHVHEFGRQGLRGNVEPIKNISTIFSGEIVYHLPTYHNTETVASRHLTEEDKKKLNFASLNHEYRLNTEQQNLISYFINYYGYSDNATLLADIADFSINNTLLTTIYSGANISAIRVNLNKKCRTLLSTNTNDNELKFYLLRAIAYAITAWAFDDVKPKESRQVLFNLHHGMPAANQASLVDYADAWKLTVNEIYDQLYAETYHRNIQKDSIQLLLKAICNGKRINLCLKLLNGFEREIGGSIVSIWRSYYSVFYPN